MFEFYGKNCFEFQMKSLSQTVGITASFSQFDGWVRELFFDFAFVFFT